MTMVELAEGTKAEESMIMWMPDALREVHARQEEAEEKAALKFYPHTIKPGDDGVCQFFGVQPRTVKSYFRDWLSDRCVSAKGDPVVIRQKEAAFWQGLERRDGSGQIYYSVRRKELKYVKDFVARNRSARSHKGVKTKKSKRGE